MYKHMLCHIKQLPDIPFTCLKYFIYIVGIAGHEDSQTIILFQVLGDTQACVMAYKATNRHSKDLFGILPFNW